MQVKRAGIIAAGVIAVACTEHAVTAPRVDELTAAKAVSPSSAQSNRFEPVGYARTTERAFLTKAHNARDAAGAEGWDAGEYRYSALSTLADNSAPRSSPSVLQVTFPRRSQGGETIARVETSLQGSPRQVYFSLWMKLSPSWSGRGDLAQLWIAGAPRLTLGIDAARGATPRITAALSSTGSRVTLRSTARGASVERGAWHRIELVTKSNTPGSADGLLDLWIDGVEALTTHTVQFINTGESDVWQRVALAPTWGQTGDRVPRTMYMWWDHVYVSGSPSTADPAFATQTVATAVADPTIFSDGFESGDLSAWQDGVNTTKQRVVTDSTLAHSGTRVLAMSYPAGEGGGWLTRFFMPGYDSVYVSYWVRPDSTWTGTTALLGLRGSRTDNQWSSFGKAIACPSGSDFFSTTVVSGAPSAPLDLLFSTHYPGMPTQSDGTCRGASQGVGSTTYAPNRRLTPGVWHKVEFFVKLNTVGQSDGVQRMWLDGQLAGEWSGLILRTNNILELNSLMLDGSATASHSQTLYIDDVEVLGAPPAVQPPPPPPPVASVSVTLNSPTLLVGQSTQAVATLKDASGNVLSDRALTWASSDTTLATVSSSGLVNALKVGSATVTGTSEGVSGAATITVNPPPVATVTVTLNAPSLTLGQSTQAVATLKDASGNTLTGRVITWTSSNAGVATVNGAGLVTSIAAGSTSITATSEGVSGSTPLSVVAPPPPPSGSIFSEGFESGVLSAWQDGVNPSKQQVLNNSSLAHSGTHVLQMTYQAGQDAGWLTRFFQPGYDSLYASYWVRFDANWIGGTKLIDFRGSRIDNQWSAFGKAGVCPSGTDYFSTSVTTSDQLDLSFYTYYPAMAREPDGVTCYGRYSGTGTTNYATSRRITRGVWHQIEFWVKLNTLGQNNAVQRVWLDGQLVGEWTGFALRTSDVLRLNSLTIDGSGGSSSQTEHVYVDDVQVLTAMPEIEPPPPPPPVPVASVSVTLNSSSLDAGQSTQATATLRDGSGNVLSGRTVTWSSSNPSVASVSGTGFVTARAAGTTNITATSEGVSGAASLTVIVPPPAPVASASVTLGSSNLTVGQTTVATAVLKDASGNVLTGRSIAWASSNQSIATVSSTGLVTAHAAGSASISATSEGVTGQATLAVTAPPPPAPVAKVTVSLGSGSIVVGQTTQASVVLSDAGGNVLTGRSVTWASSNTAVATVTGTGVVLAVGAGAASITATSEGTSGSATVTVTAPSSSGEPIFVASQNRSMYYEDFESYSGSSSFSSSGWASANISLLSAPAGSGYGGGRAAQMQWPAGTKDMGMDRGVDRTGEGRVAMFTFMYRTSAGFKVDNVGKKFAIMNLGDPDRVTTGLSGLGGDGAWDLNISGLFNGNQDIFAQPNVQAFLPLSVGEYVTNGNWHRITIRRTRSSSGHAADGSIEIWVDGVKTHNLTGLALGTQPIFNIEFSGTWNNGSPQTQSEFYDNVRIWY